VTRSLAVLAAVLLVAGCSGGEPAASPQAAPSASASPTPDAGVRRPVTACPDTGATTGTWPAGVPADLPVPPTAQIGKAETTADGLTLVRFTTSQSVRQGVLFLIQNLQPAGYTLGRGDAEAIEADAPFVKGSLNGLMKMISRAPCRTEWILALQKAGRAKPGGAPLLPPVNPQASPSPLPFG
jgi:hypothetical protein